MIFLLCLENARIKMGRQGEMVMRRFGWLVAGALLAGALSRCDRSSSGGPGAVISSVQRLDPLPAAADMPLVTSVPSKVATADAQRRLGYAVGIPSGEESTLLLTIGLEPKAAPIDQLELVAVSSPGLAAIAIDAFAAIDDPAAKVAETTHLSIRAPVAPASELQVSRMLKVFPTGDPRIVKLDVKLRWKTSGGATAEKTSQVAIGILGFADGPVVTLPSGAKLSVNRGAAAPDPPPVSASSAWPDALAAALDATVAQLASSLSFSLSPSAEDATVSAVLDDVVPLIGLRVGEAEGLRIGRALGAQLALDGLRSLSLLGEAAAAGARIGMALLARDTLTVSSGAIRWIVPSPLPRAAAPKLGEGIAPPRGTLPAPTIVDENLGTSVPRDADGGYTVSVPFRISFPPATVPSNVNEDAARWLVLGSPRGVRTHAVSDSGGQHSVRFTSLEAGVYQATLEEQSPSGTVLGDPIRITVVGPPMAAPPTNLGEFLDGDDYRAMATLPGYVKMDSTLDLSGERARLRRVAFRQIRANGDDGSPTALLTAMHWDPATGKTNVTIQVSGGPNGGPIDVYVGNLKGELEYSMDASGNLVPDESAAEYADIYHALIDAPPGGMVPLDFALTGQLGSGAGSTLRVFAFPSGKADDPKPSVAPSFFGYISSTKKSVLEIYGKISETVSFVQAAIEWYKADGVVLRLQFIHPSAPSKDGVVQASTVAVPVGAIYQLYFSLEYNQTWAQFIRVQWHETHWYHHFMATEDQPRIKRATATLKAVGLVDGMQAFSKEARSTTPNQWGLVGVPGWQSAAISAHLDCMFNYICSNGLESSEDHTLALKWSVQIDTVQVHEKTVFPDGTNTVKFVDTFDEKTALFPAKVYSQLTRDEIQFAHSKVLHGESSGFRLKLGYNDTTTPTDYVIEYPHHLIVDHVTPVFDPKLDVMLTVGQLPDPTLDQSKSFPLQFEWRALHNESSHVDDVSHMARYPDCIRPGASPSPDPMALPPIIGYGMTRSRSWRVELPAPSPDPVFICRGTCGDGTVGPGEECGEPGLQCPNPSDSKCVSCRCRTCLHLGAVICDTSQDCCADAPAVDCSFGVCCLPLGASCASGAPCCSPAALSCEPTRKVCCQSTLASPCTAPGDCCTNHCEQIGYYASEEGDPRNRCCLPSGSPCNPTFDGRSCCGNETCYPLPGSGGPSTCRCAPQGTPCGGPFAVRAVQCCSGSCVGNSCQ